MQKTVLLSLLTLSLMACAGKESEKVEAMQKRDKTLTCREVLLEQNEADFYRTTAEKNKAPGVRSVLMPLGYISTYMDADEAVSAAKARTDYLARIYTILGCENKLQMADRRDRLTTRQMAESLENDEEPVAIPMPQQAAPQPAQPMVQPMVMVPQPMMMRAQPMGYAPTEAFGPVGQW